MSAVRLRNPSYLGRAETGWTAGARGDRGSRSSLALLLALLVMILYAAFSHGATALGTSARIEVALALAAALAGIVCIWGSGLRFHIPVLAGVGAVLLGLFAVWSGVTLAWSVAPDQTWIELNRALAYAIVLCLAMALGASEPRAVELTATGFLIIAMAVTVYALGQKLLPGLHLDGIFNLNQAGPLPRLQEPFGYWNALGLFLALGAPVALALAADAARATAARLAALVSLDVMLLTLAFTYSRGAMIALAVGLAVIVVAGSPLRSLMWLAVAAVALVPPLVVGLSSHSLTAPNVSLADREHAGLLLLGVLILSLLGLCLLALWMHRLEATVRLDATRSRLVRWLLAAAVALAILAGVLALALSSRGLGGSVSHAWHSFTATRATSVYEPTRLLSADSENRWVWWKEAAGAFSDRPVGGWGAGSFPVVHLLYRRDRLSVNQPHSVPLQFLAETGVVGALLALGGLALLLVSATLALRRLPRGRNRLLGAALLAGAAAYLVHCLYDWDWDIPGVTLPALIFLGVLAASRGSDGVPNRSAAAGLPVRLLGSVALALCMCAFAASALFPSLAASKASYAVVAAASSSPGTIRSAESAARLAERLDPLSDAGLRVQATIALRRREPRQARTFLLAALRRDPTDEQTWRQLAIVEAELGNGPGAIRAVSRALSLDPRGKATHDFAQLVAVLVGRSGVAPGSSATRIPTPGS